MLRHAAPRRRRLRCRCFTHTRHRLPITPSPPPRRHAGFLPGRGNAGSITWGNVIMLNIDAFREAMGATGAATFFFLHFTDISRHYRLSFVATTFY